MKQTNRLCKGYQIYWLSCRRDGAG